MRDAAADFWRFSLALYAQPGVAPACLVLQDGLGKDVNLALFCCWRGASGRGRLSGEDIAAAEAALAPWRQKVVEPLRQVRRGLKGIAGAEVLYDGLKAIELDAERGSQRLLAALAGPVRGDRTLAEREAAAMANLTLYVGESGIEAAAPMVTALGSVMAGE